MNNIIVTHADRDGLASAAVWLHEHPEINQVIAIRDPKDLGATVRDLAEVPHNLVLFDLPFSWDAEEALCNQYKLGSEILWIDHHLPAWRPDEHLVALTNPPRWRMVLPTSYRTTAVRMTMEWLWLHHEDTRMPYIYLNAKRIPGQYEILPRMWEYLLEVCGVTEQTDRVYLLDAIEKLISRGENLSSEQLIHSLQVSLSGELGQFERDLAAKVRNHIAEVEAVFAKPNPDVWDCEQGVVFVKDVSSWPLRGMPRKNISLIAQKATGATFSVIRHKQDWAYVGAKHDIKVDLMAKLRTIPGLNEGPGMVGHPYVVSMRSFSVDGQSEPIAHVAQWLRDNIATLAATRS